VELIGRAVAGNSVLGAGPDASDLSEHKRIGPVTVYYLRREPP